MKTNGLALRRDRRILRSKVFLLLKETQNHDNCLEILKENLNPHELEEVIEDTIYYVPFPEKRRTIINNCKTVEQLVDNYQVNKEQETVKVKRLKRIPTILLPNQRKKSVLYVKEKKASQTSFFNEKLKMNTSSMFQILKRIDLSNSLLNEKTQKVDSEGKNDHYKDFYKVYYQFNTQFHLNLKKKYSDENLNKNKILGKPLSLEISKKPKQNLLKSINH